jgi:hypothetical protein
VSEGARQALQCLKELDNRYGVWKKKTAPAVSERRRRITTAKELDNRYSI